MTVASQETILEQAQKEIVTLVNSTHNFKQQIDLLNGIMAKLSSEKASLESSNNQMKLQMIKLEEEYNKAKKSSENHKNAFDKERKHRQVSIIKLAEHMQKAATKEAEVSKYEKQIQDLYASIGKLTAEKDIKEDRIRTLEGKLGTQSLKQYVSSDDTVNALQMGRDGESDAVQIVMKERDALDKRLKIEVGERERVEALLQEADLSWSRKMTELEKETNNRIRKEVQHLESSLKESKAQLSKAKQREETLNRNFEACRKELHQTKQSRQMADTEKWETETRRLTEQLSGLELVNRGLENEAGIMREEMKRGREELMANLEEKRKLSLLVEETQADGERSKKEAQKWKETVDHMKDRVGRLMESISQKESEANEKVKEYGGEGFEAKIVSWAFEKLVYDVKLMLLGGGI